MHPTSHTLSPQTRQRCVELLNARLADAMDLHSQLKQAHWNLKGPGFIALHNLFDDIADDARGYADDLAERAVQLGGTALGTARLAAQRSTIPEYPHDITNDLDHARAVTAALATFADAVRKDIDNAEELADAATADLFTEITRGVDKHLWFVEAHLLQEPNT